MNFKKNFFLFFIFLFIFLFYKYIYDGTESIKSTIDDKYYKVRSEPGNQNKANLLAILNIKFNILVDALSKDPKYSKNINVQRLIKNWNQGVSIKEMGKMESDAAYVINKKHMSFCLNSKPDNNKTIDDINLMTYVGIHELSHIMSNEIGHGNEFISNFEFLLNYAKGINYYDKINNINVPLYIQLNKLNTADNYCGVPLVNSVN